MQPATLKTACTLWLLLAPAVSFGQGNPGFYFNNWGVNGGARAPVFGPEPGNPSLQLWGNPPDALPPGSQIYTGPLITGSNYSVEAWYMLDPVSDPFQLGGGATPVPGSLTIFRYSTNIPGYFIRGEVQVPEFRVSPTGAYVYLQLRDNAGGQLSSWSAAWGAAQAGSGRPVGWSAVFYQPVTSLTIPWPGLENFTSFNLFIVPEPTTGSLLLVAGASVWLCRRRLLA